MLVTYLFELHLLNITFLTFTFFQKHLFRYIIISLVNAQAATSCLTTRVANISRSNSVDVTHFLNEVYIDYLRASTVTGLVVCRNTALSLTFTIAVSRALLA